MSKPSAPLFDNPHTVSWLIRALLILCAALLVGDFIWHRHISHPIEAVWGFYAWYGFISCVALVLAAKFLRRLIMRDENYYDADQPPDDKPADTPAQR